MAPLLSDLNIIGAIRLARISYVDPSQHLGISNRIGINRLTAGT